MNKLTILLIIISVSFLQSCRTQADVLYFKNIESVINDSDVDFTNPTIQVGDLLSIRVSTYNAEISAPFNIQVGQGSGARDKNALGYLVNTDGYITMPVIGEVKVAGKSQQELSEELSEKITVYIRDPIINVRILNYRVIVLGEVNSPGIVESENQRLSIIEAIAQSGDITLYGVRDSIMLIRTVDGKRNAYNLNLQDANLINSPYYYLKQNDVLYVRPTKSKAFELNTRPITALLTFVGAIVTVFALFN